jgi:hypothetical protein
MKTRFVVLAILMGLVSTAAANWFHSSIVSGRTVTASFSARAERIPDDLRLYDSPEAAALAVARSAYPQVGALRARLLVRFPPPDDYATRVKVWGEGFCSQYGPVQNRPPNWIAKEHRVGWVAWGEGIFSVACTGE